MDAERLYHKACCDGYEAADAVLLPRLPAAYFWGSLPETPEASTTPATLPGPGIRPRLASHPAPGSR